MPLRRSPAVRTDLARPRDLGPDQGSRRQLLGRRRIPPDLRQCAFGAQAQMAGKHVQRTRQTQAQGSGHQRLGRESAPVEILGPPCRWLARLRRWLARLCRWPGRLSRWLARLCRWPARLRRWPARLRRWLAQLSRWLARLSRWLARLRRWLAQLCRWLGRLSRWLGRLRRWLGRLRRWLARLCRWPARLRRWPARLRRWLARLRRWLARLRRWLARLRRCLGRLCRWLARLCRWLARLRRWLARLRRCLGRLCRWLARLCALGRHLPRGRLLGCRLFGSCLAPGCSPCRFRGHVSKLVRGGSRCQWRVTPPEPPGPHVSRPRSRGPRYCFRASAPSYPPSFRRRPVPIG